MYGVLFDMDGVIVDSAEPHHESWRQLMREEAVSASADELDRVFGRQNRDIIREVFGVDDDDEIVRLGDRKEVIYRAIIHNRIPAMPGAADLIRDCAETGMRLAVASSGPPENIDLVVREMGLEPHFSARITSREITRGKPEPDVFIAAAKALGLAPEDCVVIEDSLPGVQAGLRSGAAVVALVPEPFDDDRSKAHRVVRSLTELTPDALRLLIDRNRNSAPA